MSSFAGAFSYMCLICMFVSIVLQIRIPLSSHHLTVNELLSLCYEIKSCRKVHSSFHTVLQGDDRIVCTRTQPPILLGHTPLLHSRKKPKNWSFLEILSRVKITLQKHTVRHTLFAERAMIFTLWQPPCRSNPEVEAQ